MDEGTARDHIADLIERCNNLEAEVLRYVQRVNEMKNMREQLELARQARARWEAAANILAGEIQKLLGTADMYKQYESHAIHWAWEQTSGDK